MSPSDTVRTRPSPAARLGQMSAAAWLPWLERELGDRVVGIRDVSSPWGSTTVTMVATLAAGRSVVLQQSADATALERRRSVSQQVAARAPELAVPRVLAYRGGPGGGALVTEWIRGEAGSTRLDDPRTARHLAADLGRASAIVRSVAASGLDLPTTWAEGSTLSRAIDGWLGDAARVLDSTLMLRLSRVMGDVPDAASGQAALAHGDLVPVNVLIDGTLLWLLDWEDASLAIPMLDIAWMRGVIRRHHPVAWRHMEAVCLEAAGFTSDRETLQRLDRLEAARALERLARAVSRGLDPARALDELGVSIRHLTRPRSR